MYGVLSWAISASLTIQVYGTHSCPDEQWKYFNDSCYLFSTRELPWNRAQNWCYVYKRLGSFLAEITSAEENEFIRERLDTEHYTRGFHIGATDFVREGTFLWAYFFEPILPGYTNWKDGSPDRTQSGNDKDCVEMIPADGTWTDIPCEQISRFVCELPFFSRP